MPPNVHLTSFYIGVLPGLPRWCNYVITFLNVNNPLILLTRKHTMKKKPYWTVSAIPFPPSLPPPSLPPLSPLPPSSSEKETLLDRLSNLEDESAAVKVSLIQLLQQKSATNKTLALENLRLSQKVSERLSLQMLYSVTLHLLQLVVVSNCCSLIQLPSCHHALFSV